jgi:hypothetical protein
MTQAEFISAASLLAHQRGINMCEDDAWHLKERCIVAALASLAESLFGLDARRELVGEVEAAFDAGVCDGMAGLDSEPEDDGRDYDDCPLDGDHDSAMTSIGWGTDEDYGYYGDDGGW